MLSRSSLQALIMLLLAVGGLIFGLFPQLLVYFSIGAVSHLLLLFFMVYAAFFFSLAMLPLGMALIAKKGGVPLPVPGLRVAALIEAAGLSVMWYKALNPFPVGPLVENQQYAVILPMLFVLLLSWLFFAFLVKKLL